MKTDAGKLCSSVTFMRPSLLFQLFASIFFFLLFVEVEEAFPSRTCSGVYFTGLPEAPSSPGSA